MSGQIFISYRRDDSLGTTGRLYDRLLDNFEQHRIFIDVDTIQPGEDFVEAIEKAVSSCAILIAVIGKDWIDMRDAQDRRMLDNTADFVRTEIRAALQRNIRVIPVLVEDATMPLAEELPEDIRVLSRRNAIELSHTRFNSDVDRLIKSLQKILGEESAVQAVESVPVVEQQPVKPAAGKLKAVPPAKVVIKEKVKTTPATTKEKEPKKKMTVSEMFWTFIVAVGLVAAGFAALICIFTGYDIYWTVFLWSYGVLFSICLLGHIVD